MTQSVVPFGRRAAIDPEAHAEADGLNVRAALKLYWRAVFRPYAWSILALAALSSVMAALSVVSVGIVVPVIESLNASTEQGAIGRMTAVIAVRVGLEPRGTPFLLLALCFVTAALIARTVLSVLYQWVTYHMAISAWHRICREMLRVGLQLRLSELIERGRGTLVHDIQSPPQAVSEVISNTSRALASLVELILLLAFVFYLSWWATLIGMGVGAAGLFVLRRNILTRINSCQRESYELLQTINALIVDAIDGVRVVKLGRAAERLLARLDSLLRRQRRFGVQYGLLSEIPNSGLEVVLVIPLLLIVGLSVGTQELAITAPALAGLVLAFVRMKTPTQVLTQAGVSLAANLRKLEVIDDAFTRLTVERSEPAGGTAVLRGPAVGELTFRDVSFGYRPGQRILNGVSFECRRGEVTAIVGSTGSGKTTIADLIARFYEPQEGAVMADGVDIAQLSLADWRRQLGYVSQDCFLFSASLRDNLTLWDELVTENQIEKAVNAAHLQDVITDLPRGYEEMLGDRGVRLSGGQRQRVAIARALVHEPQILIFDEATSALDTLTERAIHDAIASLRRTSLVVIIAHRMSTVREADQVVVIDAGRVAEQGTHAELVARRGLYWQLCQAGDTPRQGVSLRGTP